MNIDSNFKYFISGILKSYTQIFFSEKIFFSFIILIVTFFDFFAGLCGLIAVVTANTAAFLLGFDRFKTSKGFYGFNSLLVGLGLGINFQEGLLVVFVVIASSLLSFFISVALENIIGKYYLPYMSIPFLLTVWIVMIATRQFNNLALSERGVFMLNELYNTGGLTLIEIYKWGYNIELFNSLRIYFSSLGAIFFQYNVLTGILIAIGLIYHSRIAFTLSLIGFYSAYLFHHFAGINFTELGYSYIGFNYILTAIAVGGFFMVPSRMSYLMTLIIIPVTVLITIGFGGILIAWRIPVFSLPFNIIVLLFVLSMKLRIHKSDKLSEVFIQQKNPEINLYSFVNNNHRFKNHSSFPVRLPFFGEWTVSQAHNGEYTHKDKWKYAYDFIIKDSESKSFKNNSLKPEDYYCYNRAVLAPADGTVELVVDGIPDNKIGDVNIENNWGNTIIIKHNDKLFSQLSHLKQDSFKVKKGDWVKSGQILALCGNSGRSPEPHLHFQIQELPVLGAETIDYPVSNYIIKNIGSFDLKSYDRPQLDDNLSNLEINTLMNDGFHFIPEKELVFEYNSKNKIKKIVWVIKTDINNNSYIHCPATDSYAFFSNFNGVFYFYNFIGKKKSLLNYLYLALYKVPLGFNEKLVVRDSVPLHSFFSRTGLFMQDFLAPFFIYLNSIYELHYEFIDNVVNPSQIILSSNVKKYLFRIKTGEVKFKLNINQRGISNLTVIDKKKEIKLKCLK